MNKLISLHLFTLLLGQLMLQGQTADELKLNQIQVLGSHNSYKQAIDPALMAMLNQRDSVRFRGLDYEHLTLSEQLDRGMRKLELDIMHDPKGGRYANPMGLSMLTSQGQKASPYNEDGAMDQPGFKVLHIQDIDFRSNCPTLAGCLSEILNWSEAHPNHLPIAISFNAKDTPIDQPGFTQPFPFTSQVFDSLDQEILSVVPREKIITPDEVRGKYKTLERAVLDQNWPTIGESRGKLLFVLDERGEKLEAYRSGHPSLQDRVMFVLAEAGTPEAAFMIINNPLNSGDEIRKMVQKGYLVRTRADANTVEAREGDYSRLDAALTSGAQFISTDYYEPNPKFDTDYQVSLPNGEVARCNPVFDLANCKNIVWE